MRLHALAAAAALAFLFQAPQEAKKPARPAVGAPAPAFRLNDHTGRAVEVGPNEAGRWTVLAFYPKAATPGCTREVCSLRDSLEELGALGVDVYGLSLDDVIDQAAFAEAQELTYGLLSDPDGSAAAKYGVLTESERGRYTQRVTFVLDEKGVLRHVDESVQVSSHGDDLAARIRELKKGEAGKR